MAGNAEVLVPVSKSILALSEVLKKNGYLESLMVKDQILTLKLKYNGKTPVLSGVRRISKPSTRIYTGKKDLPIVMGGLGVAVISTPKGLLTNKEAKKAGLGGEVICYVW